MDERSKKNYTEYYELLNIIGEGANGIVYKGRDKKTKILRAIKVLSIEKLKENLLYQYEDKEEIDQQLNRYINRFIEEFQIMRICSYNNSNSVKCYEYFNNKDNFVIIMELCDENLSELLCERIKNKKKGFNSKEICLIMSQLNNTFKIMKENNIIHRNLKLENILIKYNEENKNYTLKLSAYGCSKRLSLSTCWCNSFEGTVSYMAPEILKREKYNYKCDLWSIGIIIYKLIFGNSPYRGEQEIAIINNIEKFGNKIIKKSGDEELDDLIKKLLEKEPIKRICWDEYFNNPFFKYKIENIFINDIPNVNTKQNNNEAKDSKNDLLFLLNEEKEKVKHLTELLNAEKNKTQNLSNDLEKEKEKVKYLIDELKKEKDKNKQLLNKCNDIKKLNFNLNNNMLNK